MAATGDRLCRLGTPGVSWEAAPDQSACFTPRIPRRKYARGFSPGDEHTPFPWGQGAPGGSNRARERARTQTGHIRHHGAAGVKEYRLRRRDGAAWRDIGKGDEKTRNINGLVARAALERESEVRAYRAEAVDRGRFPGVTARKQPCRRKRGSGCEDSLGNRAVPWGTGAVLPRISAVP